MRVRLTITPALLLELHWRVLEAPGGVELPAGIGRSRDVLEFLLPAPPDGAAAGAVAIVRRLPPGLEACSELYWLSVPRMRRAGPVLELALHGGRGCSAAAFVDGELLAVDEVLLAGVGMDRWIPGRTPADLRGAVPANGRHSRYAGALGGRGVHDRLRQVACVGIAAARLGSALTLSLAKAGCPVVAVDPDVLEAHSEDAIECFPGGGDGHGDGDSGRGGSAAGGAGKVRSKAIEVARFAAVAAPWTRVHALPLAADAPEVLAAVRDCRLVFSAPDRDDARFCAALLATAFHRVHIDLGTGVFDDNGRWQAGADVRLILPGQGCLLCIGGLDLQQEPPPD